MPFNQEDLIETFNFLQLFGFLSIYLGDFIYNGMFKLEERRIRRNKRIQLKEVNEDVDDNKLVDCKRSATNIEM